MKSVYLNLNLFKSKKRTKLNILNYNARFKITSNNKLFGELFLTKLSKSNEINPMSTIKN